MPAPPKPSRVFWANYRIKGAYYYQDTPAYAELQGYFKAHIGEQRLIIEREPNNRHDTHAIKVMIPYGDNGKGVLMGYVGKEFNQQLGALMDHFGMKVHATLSRKGTSFAGSVLYMDVYLETERPPVTNNHVMITGSLTVDGSLRTNIATKAYVDGLIATPKIKPIKKVGEDIFV